ncbi:hypothetical protein HED60_13125 [Planctomycetales bacterium ZRK34]|nr:hypothetical protein HED60_13125 [Planctomycetales bacterium ZRK34]
MSMKHDRINSRAVVILSISVVILCVGVWLILTADWGLRHASDADCDRTYQSILTAINDEDYAEMDRLYGELTGKCRNQIRDRLRSGLLKSDLRYWICVACGLEIVDRSIVERTLEAGSGQAIKGCMLTVPEDLIVWDDVIRIISKRWEEFGDQPIVQRAVYARMLGDRQLKFIQPGSKVKLFAMLIASLDSEDEWLHGQVVWLIDYVYPMDRVLNLDGRGEEIRQSLASMDRRQLIELLQDKKEMILEEAVGESEVP